MDTAERIVRYYLKRGKNPLTLLDTIEDNTRVKQELTEAINRLTKTINELGSEDPVCYLCREEQEFPEE